ncbi:hypothetical protein LCGC14_0972260 [marine sediment metagenome]|uniref:Phage capsid-like C-terminal domain-containing protein n=1 Tax=marine sediment metagenome TaxID=412755 RepID=A0A0F9QUI3_9ZZZZ
MKTINDLYSEKGVIIEKIRGLQDKADAEDRDFTGDELTTLRALESSLGQISARVKSESNLLVEEAQMRDQERIDIASIQAAGVSGSDINAMEDVRKKGFHEFLRRGGHNTHVEYRASTDPQTIGVAADGGSTVPDEWWRELVEKKVEANVMRQLATIISSESGTLTVVKDDVAGVSSLYAESAEIVAAKETFATATFSAYKIGRIVKITNELINDSMFNIEQFISRRIARSDAILEEQLFVTGTGSSQPNGIFTAATTGITAASATAITSDELFELKHSIIKPYRKNAVWLMNDSTLLLISKLKGGDQQYLWRPGLERGAPDILLGHEVHDVSNAPEATSGLDSILFGDVSGYWIVDRVGFSLLRLVEKYAEFDQIGFRGTSRTDGDLVETEAVRVLTMGT